MSYKASKANGPAPANAKKFQTFEDLEVYKAAREFRKAVYAMSRCLPELEKYDLGRQIRRAAVSLTNNMAEGHGRFHYPDQIRFFLHSRGSLEELVDDLNLRHLRNRSNSVRETNEKDSEDFDELDDLVCL